MLKTYGHEHLNTPVLPSVFNSRSSTDFQKTPIEYVGKRLLRPFLLKAWKVLQKIDKVFTRIFTVLPMASANNEMKTNNTTYRNHNLKNEKECMITMTTMQAVVLNKFGTSDQFTLKEVDLPKLENNQILIHVKAAGFNPVDYKIREGRYGGNAPEILGCDCSGVVEQVGPNSTDKFKKGDEVYGMSFVGTGKGSYAQYAIIPEELVAKKPTNLTHTQAAGVPLAAMTAFRATIANRAFQKGDTVFIAGAGGGVGSFAVQMLQSLGVKEIYTIARTKKSADYLYDRLGIPLDHIVIYEGLSQTQLETKLVELNKGKLFDGTLDLIGGERKELCLNLTKHSGHFSTILPEKDNFNNYPFWGENDLPRSRNLSVHQVNIGSEMGSKNLSDKQIYIRHMDIINQMLKDGRLKPPSITSIGSLSAKNVQQAHEMLESGRVKGKLVMEVS